MKNLSPSNRILAWIAIAILATGVIAAVLNGSNVTEYAESTPEGTVQRYVNALLEGDDEAADQYLTPTQRAECSADDSFRFVRHTDDARIALLESDVDGGSARLTVRVTEGSFGLFDSSEYSHDERYELEQIDGSWLIDDQTWPRYGC